MWQTMVSAWKIPELRKKLLFTLFIVVIFRFGSVAVLVPGIDTVGLKTLFETYSSQGNLLGYFNILSGGALSYGTLFALSITPYINSSIIIQLLTIAIPALERLAKDGGEEGKKKISQITRYVTVALALLQGFTYYIILKNNNLLLQQGVWNAAVIILSLTAGACIVMWLGDKLSEKGIGNGISMLLFAGIIARAPQMVIAIWSYMSMGGWWIPAMIGVVIIFVLMVVLIVYVTNAERRVPIQYAKRMVGRKLYGGQSTNLPMKVNMSGVLPVIFASTLLMFPSTIIQFFTPQAGSFLDKLDTFFSPQGAFYAVMYALLIFAFSYFYSAIQFNPVEVANNIKKNGGFVMGYRPGKPTSDFIAKILSKITFIGAAFLMIIAVFPTVFGSVTGITAITLGGTSLLIVVSVALETVKQLESQIMMRHYKGFLE